MEHMITKFHKFSPTCRYADEMGYKKKQEEEYEVERKVKNSTTDQSSHQFLEGNLIWSKSSSLFL